MEISESTVHSVILHQVGNRLKEEPLTLADECFAITEGISNVILGGYLRGIVNNKNQYQLTHESDMALNDVAHHVSNFFSRTTSFIELSKNLAAHLYKSTHHPNIAAGDLFVILFNKLKIDGIYKSAIGIYKSESKQQYISTRTEGKKLRLEISNGINPDLIDKGALIVEGSDFIYAIDRLSSRTKYWLDDFLSVKQIPNESTKAAVAGDLIGKICENVDNPIARQEFCHEVMALCSNQDEVLGNEIKAISEKYTPADIWDSEFDKIIERKGLIASHEISVSAKSLEAKIKKVLRRVDLAHDISLIIPDGISFRSADFKTKGKTLQIIVLLEDKNG